MHSEMGPVWQNPIQRTVRIAHLKAWPIIAGRLTILCHVPTIVSRQNDDLHCRPTMMGCDGLECAYDCAQLQYTIQHRTVLIISPVTPLDSYHSSDVVYWRKGATSPKKSYHDCRLSTTCGDNFSSHGSGFCGVFLVRNWHTVRTVSTTTTTSASI